MLDVKAQYGCKIYSSAWETLFKNNICFHKNIKNIFHKIMSYTIGNLNRLQLEKQKSDVWPEGGNKNF